MLSCTRQPLASSCGLATISRCAQRWPTTTWSSCSRLVSVELVAPAAVGEAAMLVVLGCVPSGSCRSRAGTGGSGLCVFNLIESYTHTTSPPRRGWWFSRTPTRPARPPLTPFSCFRHEPRSRSLHPSHTSRFQLPGASRKNMADFCGRLISGTGKR